MLCLLSLFLLTGLLVVVVVLVGLVGGDVVVVVLIDGVVGVADAAEGVALIVLALAVFVFGRHFRGCSDGFGVWSA